MLSQRCIKCSEEFGSDEIEVPLEDDETLSIGTLQSIFPTAKGLKFKNPLTNCFRVVKIDTEQRFHAPGITESDGWDSENTTYICVFPKNAAESKTEEGETPDSTVGGGNGPAQPKTVDLIILNLGPQTNEEELRGYFESKFGPLLMAEIKRDRKTNASRRFAFIRFKNYKDQMKALSTTKHKIDGQAIRVALPDYRDPSELYQENKCFIGRVNETIKSSDLRDFFSRFGDIVEVSYPKKFKGYAFITFADAEVAKRICGQDFVINGYSVCVSKSTHGSANKQPMGGLNQRLAQTGGYNSDWSNGWFQRDNWGGAGSSRDNWPHASGGNYQANSNLDAARNNSNYYGHSAGLSSMGNSMLNNSHSNPLSVLQMAMGNLLNNSMGQGNNYQRDRPHGTLWTPRPNDQKAKKSNKKKNNKKNKPKAPGEKGEGEKGEGDEQEDVKEETSESSPAEPADPAEPIEAEN